MAKPNEKHWTERLGKLALGGNVARAFAQLLRPGSGAESFAAQLPASQLDRLGERIDECLAARGGAFSARARAAELGRSYLALEPEGRRRFLKFLSSAYGPDRAAIDQAAAALASASVQSFPAARRVLAQALIPARIRLLQQFNSLEQGVKFLVDLRADLLAAQENDPDLAALESELHDLLGSWFDIGFLELRRITWDAPASLLEKLVAYEAVHEIRSWDDLKNRLDSDRRCYAYFHPAMPDEPLIFVEVALVDGLAGSVQALLDEHAPAYDPARANTAIFYSISNAQKGLSGVAFGEFLIKRVVDTLARDLPNLKTFATLSPIPGFRRWLEKEAKSGLTLRDAPEAGALSAFDTSLAPEQLLTKLIGRAEWHKDERLARVLEPILLRLCARYLVSEKRRDGSVERALDPVAHFHLSNGARVERINWLGDVSKNGFGQSAGLMVNYLYRLGDIESNHERYRAEGRVAVSSSVKGLL